MSVAVSPSIDGDSLRSRRHCAGADGSRRNHLHAEEAGVRAVSPERGLRGAAAWRPGHLIRARQPRRPECCGRGAAFVVVRGDDILVRSRPEKGLLGGMTEVPGSEWLAGQEDAAALAQAPDLTGVARWRRKLGVVTHVFTHFPLELVVYTARVPARTRAPGGMRWVPIATLDGEALPNVMRKVVAHGLGE